jgi:hypothetical protein
MIGNFVTSKIAISIPENIISLGKFPVACGEIRNNAPSDTLLLAAG